MPFHPDDEAKVYHRMISSYKKIIYVYHYPNDDIVEYFTLEQFLKDQINDVSRSAFEQILKDHELKDLGMVSMNDILAKL